MIWKKELYRLINSNTARIRELKDSFDRRNKTSMRLTDFVECDICGCLLNKKTAIRGESTVEKASECKHQFETVYAVAYVDPVTEREVIKEHYYCKIHEKKKKK